MRIVFPIAALLSIVFLFFYMPLFATYVDTLDMDFDQYKLDKSLELSTRAAAENGLEHGLVTFDRAVFTDVEFNANVVLTTYSQFMCFNYNLVPTEENKEYILGRSVLMVVGGRGFNVTQNEFGDYYHGADGKLHRTNGAVSPGVITDTKSANNTGARTIFGPYITFSVEDRTAPINVERYVSGSLLPGAVVFPVYERDHRACASGTLDTCTSCPVGVYVKDNLSEVGVTVDRIRQEALALMSRAYTQAWTQLNMQSASEKQLTMPDSVTAVGVSNAARPGVMALIEGVSFDSSKLLRSEAFTGYQAVVRREVIAFTQTVAETGQILHWYCYRDQIDMEAAENGTGEYAGVKINYVYPTMIDAALAKIPLGMCPTHPNSMKCVCPDYEGGPPTLPHCHYQPHLGFLTSSAGSHSGG